MYVYICMYVCMYNDFATSSFADVLCGLMICLFSHVSFLSITSLSPEVGLSYVIHFSILPSG